MFIVYKITSTYSNYIAKLFLFFFNVRPDLVTRALLYVLWRTRINKVNDIVYENVNLL